MRWSRRRRRAVGAIGIAFVFVVAVGWWTFLRSRPAATYLPGQEIEGLTNELDRRLPEDAPRLKLVDATIEAGIGFRHFPGPRTGQLPEDMGSGAAWGDFDSDGYPDLYLVNLSANLASTDDAGINPMPQAWLPESGNRLYRNLGDGRFEDVTESSGTGIRVMGSGAAWADCDADGDLDLMVTAYGSLTLLRNEGNASFTSLHPGTPSGFWTGLAWADYDRDGDLDAYVTGYVKYRPGLESRSSMQYQVAQPESLNPSAFEPERNLLLANSGNCSFRDMAEEAGVANPGGRSLSAAFFDADSDGWQDLYVANDVSDNVLYLNMRDGSFLDASHGATVADYRGAMGIAVGDWNGDALDDLFITHWLAQENALFEARPGTLAPVAYMDMADRVGLGQVALDFVGWATAFVDFDLDGRPDLFAVNGSTVQGVDSNLIPMRDQVFWNAGSDRGFFELGTGPGPWFDSTAVGRGGAAADYDRDGDVDLVIVNHGSSAVLLRNDTAERGHFLGIALAGERGNPEGVGSRVAVWRQGASIQATVGSQPSYLSQNDSGLLFGLGDAPMVDSVTVVWPNGDTTATANPRTDTWLRLSANGSVRPLLDATSSPGPGDPRTFWTVYRRATSLRLGGDFAAALPLLEQAVAIDPSHRDARYYLGIVLHELGRFGDAERAWTHLTEAESSSARGFRQLGALRMCWPGSPTFDPVGAREALEAAWAINREETGVQLLLARLDVLDSAPAARQRLESILVAHPDNRLAAGLLGFVLAREGRPNAGLEAMNAAGSVEAPVLPGATAEGDTRDGIARLERRDQCPLFQAFDSAVEAGPVPVTNDWAGRIFAALEAALEDARR